MKKLNVNYEVTFPDGNLISIIQDSVGMIKIANELSHLNKTQVLEFDKNGNLIQKIMLNDQFEIDSRLYTFYKESGCLESDLAYSMGKPIGTGIVFHDGTDQIKQLSFYNDEGKEYFRQIYNMDGKLIEEHGSRE